VRAKVLAHRGDLDEAEPLARRAVALADETDFPNLRGDARLNLAEVIQNTDRRRAMQLTKEAIELYSLKGNIVSVQRARASQSPAQEVELTQTGR
jgi:hypothetical protein